VDKVLGKQLSTNDFTNPLKEKLEKLSEYDSEVVSKVNSLQNQINTLVNGNSSNAIESFNEIISFLEEVKDSENLNGVIASIETQISNTQKNIPTKISQLTNDSGFIDSHQDISHLATKNELELSEKVLSHSVIDLDGRLQLVNNSISNVKSDLSEVDSKIDDVIGELNGSVSEALKTKQDIIEDLDTIREGSALGATSLQEHQDISHLANKSEVQNLSNELVTNEEICAASINDLNFRIQANDNYGKITYATKEDVSKEFASMNNVILGNEEVNAATLNDLNFRINIIDNYGKVTYATKNSVETSVNELYNTILTNEEIIAAALAELNSKITILENRINLLENA
jgi:hypothetical protein